MQVTHEFGLPVRKTTGSCGYDLVTPIDLVLHRGHWNDVSLGLKMDGGDIPEGYFGLIVPRSSTGFKYGLRLKNTIGIIDSSYTMDYIHASLTVDVDKIEFPAGTRILQMILVPYGVIPSEIPPVEERTGGRGSTGER